MKKIFTLLFAIMATTCLWAWDFKSGDLFYNIISDSNPYTVEVTYQLDNRTNYSGLVTVNIPNTVSHNGQTYMVQSIGANAFRDCATLKSISVPSSVKHFGKNAFYHCKSLQITNYMGDIAGWCTMRFSGSYSNPISQSHRFYIKDQELRKAFLPAIDTIPEYLFDGCTSLESITIPTSVKHFGKNAFYGCNSLQTTNYMGDIAQWCTIRFDGSYANPICRSRNLLINNRELTELIIPNTIDSIGDNQFDCCASITSVTIPNSVKYIGNGAFYKCSSVATITIPASVTKIQDRAFSGCDSLVMLMVEEGNTVYDSRNHCNAIIETASNTLVAGCATTIIPEDVTKIGKNAFSHHTSLLSITIPASVKIIDDLAFNQCSALASITLFDGLEAINLSAFAGCKLLTNIALPTTIKYIGETAFSQCVALKSVVIPNGVTSIKRATFHNCTSLQFLMLPATLMNIEDQAFGKCTSLVSVTLPTNIITLGNYIFANCSSIKMLIYDGTIEKWNNISKSKTWKDRSSISYIQCKNGKVKL